MPRYIRTGLVLLNITCSSPIYADLRENIEYGRAGGSSLQLDARIPEGKGPFAAAIIVHGGAWVTGDRRRSVEPLFEPLAGARIATFSISYRLPKRGPEGFNLANNISQMLAMGTQIEDVRQAVDYVKSHAEEFSVDPRRIALIGESAGAQLAAMAALRPNRGGEVRAVVALYGPNDLVKLVQSSPWIPEPIRQSLEGTMFANLLLSGLRDVSPVYWVSKDAPPFLLIHGTADSLVPFEQSEEMYQKLRTESVRCELYSVPGGHHGLRWWEAEGRTAYKDHMVAWLRHELR
jgi:acetyl esterase